jgi:hypothetical protein
MPQDDPGQAGVSRRRICAAAAHRNPRVASVPISRETGSALHGPDTARVGAVTVPLRLLVVMTKELAITPAPRLVSLYHRDGDVYLDQRLTCIHPDRLMLGVDETAIKAAQVTGEALGTSLLSLLELFPVVVQDFHRGYRVVAPLVLYEAACARLTSVFIRVENDPEKIRAYAVCDRHALPLVFAAVADRRRVLPDVLRARQTPWEITANGKPTNILAGFTDGLLGRLLGYKATAVRAAKRRVRR